MVVGTPVKREYESSTLSAGAKKGEEEMRKILIVFFAVLALSLISCGSNSFDADSILENKVEQDKIAWGAIKSPLTGRCYEVFSYLASNGHYSASYLSVASEVECSFVRVLEVD